MNSLYEIALLSKKAQDDLCDLELDEQVIADTLAGIAGDLQAKATNVAMVVKNMEAMAEAIGDAIQKMQDRKRFLTARAERIKEYIRGCMEAGDIMKIECPYFVLSIKKNPPKVVILEEDEIPAAFMKIPDPPEPTVDKKAIADAIKAGVDVRGAKLEFTKRLEIK